jgi:hypothetical protein
MAALANQAKPLTFVHSLLRSNAMRLCIAYIALQLSMKAAMSCVLKGTADESNNIILLACCSESAAQSLHLQTLRRHNIVNQQAATFALAYCCPTSRLRQQNFCMFSPNSKSSAASSNQ